MARRERGAAGEKPGKSAGGAGSQRHRGGWFGSGRSTAWTNGRRETLVALPRFELPICYLKPSSATRVAAGDRASRRAAVDDVRRGGSARRGFALDWRRVAAVHGTRGLIRPDLIASTAVPDVDVSPDDGEVALSAAACSPASGCRDTLGPAVLSSDGSLKGAGTEEPRPSLAAHESSAEAFSPTSSGMTARP